MDKTQSQTVASSAINSYLRLYLRLSKIPPGDLVGRILRAPFRLIPKSREIKILQGYNKGANWILGSGISAYWLGGFEFFKQRILAERTKNGMTAYDIGGHVGFHTLLFSRLVGESGHVYAFEPNPRNSSYLRRHLKINSVKNVVLLPISVGEKNSVSFFDDETDSSMGHIAEEKTQLFVPVYNLDSLALANLILPPDIIKIDAEGAEKQIILGAQGTLSKYKPFLQIALHIPGDNEFIFQFLRGLNYKIETVKDCPDEIIAEYDSGGR